MTPKAAPPASVAPKTPEAAPPPEISRTAAGIPDAPPKSAPAIPPGLRSGTTPPLPNQWDSLLGSSPDQAPAESGAVPPDLLDRVERMEKRLEQLEALLNKMENNAREELDRAAAAAAARILREELATLFAAGAE